MGRIATVIRERQDWWLSGVLCLVFILNVIDALMTIAWVTADAAIEANPAMDRVLQMGPIPFFLFKMTLVGLGSILLWRHRRRPLAVVGIFFLFLVYYTIIIYHFNMFGEAITGGLVVPSRAG